MRLLSERLGGWLACAFSLIWACRGDTSPGFRAELRSGSILPLRLRCCTLVPDCRRALYGLSPHRCLVLLDVAEPAAPGRSDQCVTTMDGTLANMPGFATAS